MYTQESTIQFANAEAPSHNIDKDSLAINGYDLIEYFINNKAIKGSSKFQYKYQGIKYIFLNEKNKSSFIENPQKYLPQYGGYCAYGLAMDSGIDGNPPGKYSINPETFKIIDNKLYLFYNFDGINALKAWEQNERESLEKSKKRWNIINKTN